MSRRDDLHIPVRRALENEGWVITHDPLRLVFREFRFEADLGAERRFGAQKGGRKIAVEVKDFDSASLSSELQKTIGQMQYYQLALDEQEPDRKLFLAVSHSVYGRYFHMEAVKAVIDLNRIKLLVFDEIREVILQWIEP
jgi:hypothetical protein